MTTKKTEAASKTTAKTEPVGKATSKPADKPVEKAQIKPEAKTADANAAADKTTAKTAEGTPAKESLTSTSGQQVEGAHDVRQEALEGAADGDADNNLGSVTNEPLEGVPTQYVGGTSHEEEIVTGLDIPENDPRDGVPLTQEGLPKYDPEAPFDEDGQPNVTEAGEQEQTEQADAQPSEADEDEDKAPAGHVYVTAIEGFTHGEEGGDTYSFRTGERRAIPSKAAKALNELGLTRKD